MAPGMTFDRQSVKRIARAVRQSESTQVPPETLSRRRAGGLGRASLWEVTAVNTGAETCTLERVENQDFDLIARSEREDVLYDPDNEPSVGDRGLVVRLGEGSLFFFRRAAAAGKINITDWGYIDEDNPATNYYQAGLLTWQYNPNVVSGRDKRMILKLGSTASTIADILLSLGVMATPPPGGGGQGVVLRYGHTTGSFAAFDVRIETYAITQDFDPTTVTWNTAAGLSKTMIDTQRFVFPSLYTPSGSLQVIEMLEEPGVAQNEYTVHLDITGAYGLEVRAYHAVYPNWNAGNFGLAITAPIQPYYFAV